MQRVGRFAIVLALVVLGAGWGTPDTDPVSLDLSPPPTGPSEDAAAEPPTSHAPDARTIAPALSAASPATAARRPEGGISEDEAEEGGVAAGRYDALLEGPVSAREQPDGCAEATFRLTNVGRDADSYVIAGNEAVASIEPDRPPLAADESATIVVMACDRSIDEVVFDVCSNGLGGTIARYES